MSDLDQETVGISCYGHPSVPAAAFSRRTKVTFADAVSPPPPAANVSKSGTNSRSTASASPQFIAVQNFLLSAAFLPPQAENHTTSTCTRKPGKWDRHLGKEYALKKVEYLPSLEDSLSALARDALNVHPSLPPLDELSEFSSALGRAKTHKAALSITPIRVEQDLANYYGQTTAAWCMTAATMLEYQLGICERASVELMEWTTTSKERLSNGLGDGFLRSTGKYPEILPNNVQSKLRHMSRSFPDLAVWEFKNLAVGDTLSPDAILTFTQHSSFPWQICEISDRCGLVHQQTPSQKDLVFTPTMFSPDFDLSKVNIDLTKTESWKRDPKSDAIKETHLEDGRDIIQQIWAEAVRIDSTFVIIYAGAYELIGIRNRAKQTLYLSGVIRPAVDPGYFGIETGLYMAIFREATDRASLLIPKDVGAKKTKPSRTKQLRKKLDLTQLCSSDELVWKLKTARVKAAANTGFMPFILERPYVRQMPVGIAEGPLAEYWEETKTNSTNSRKMMVANAVEYGTSMICRASLTVDGQPYAPAGNLKEPELLFVKNACARQRDVEALGREAAVCHYLSEKKVQGVPAFIGYFCMKPAKEVPPASSLVLFFAGTPFPSSPLTNNQKRKFVKILDNIHSAGILHQDIHPNNLLVRERDQDVFIVGFSKARRITSEKGAEAKELKKEKDNLKRLLGMDAPGDDSSDLPPIPDPRGSHKAPTVGHTLTLVDVPDTGAAEEASASSSLPHLGEARVDVAGSRAKRQSSNNR
ncbi:hypothetical protein C8R45DRAFT_1076074 [Mycena sanguinolenta]|nr:hypothetical protein C8R45DRAFT_1076074 [Mycena sanguinolenta]